MRKFIEVKIADLDLLSVEVFLNENPGLRLEDLLELLVQDVALVVRRPGSSEGVNMIRVLESHGFNI